MVKPGQKYIVKKTLNFWNFKIPRGTVVYATKVIPNWTQALLASCVPIVWEKRVRIVTIDALRPYVRKR